MYFTGASVADTSGSDASTGADRHAPAASAAPTIHGIMARMSCLLSIPQMVVKVRPVGRRMAAGAEARPVPKPPRVAAVPDAWEVDLRVAAQAQVVVPRLQHFLMDRAVDLMAAAASFPQGFMLEHERPALGLMALEAGLVDALDAGCGRRPDVRGVTVGGIHIRHFFFLH